MGEVLASGYNIIMSQKVGDTTTPIYPFTRTSNIKDAKGNTLDEIIQTLATTDYGNYVPDYSNETASSLRFLRNDNTWATIQNASTEQAGVVQLTDSTSLDDSTVAATAKAVKAAYDIGNHEHPYVKTAQLGVASTDTVTGVATLDTSGLVPSSMLPSYVDDVLEIVFKASTTEEGEWDYTTAYDIEDNVITGESGKIYVVVSTNKIYRWTGSIFVNIPESLSLGETSATAFDGARGLVAYQHSQADHARVDATKVEDSELNGYIKIDGTDTAVYVHPTVEGGTTTNPHGTTKADVGLGNVENLNAAGVIATMTSGDVETALGYTPANSTVLATSGTSGTDGLMSNAMATKLDGCMEVVISADTPTKDCLFFQIITD